MSLRVKRREGEVDPFYDMLFNILIAFVFCFIIALMAMNPKAKKEGDIPAKAEFIITVSWPDMNPNDIDTYVQDPGGAMAWFRQRESGLMHLDRDDRGSSNNTIMVNGKKVVNPLRQEVTTGQGAPARILRHHAPVFHAVEQFTHHAVGVPQGQPGHPQTLGRSPVSAVVLQIDSAPGSVALARGMDGRWVGIAARILGQRGWPVCRQDF